MKPIMQESTESRHAMTRSGTPHHYRVAGAAPAASALNTILAVREHAPAEIQELEAEIHALHHRLAVSHARKRLLEQLLTVIADADAAHAPRQPGMAVVR
jgi:hypothetical protein